jgi:hypothetical protein
MPSWEEDVSWVSVGSSPGAIREAGQRWQSVFSQLEHLRDEVNKLQRDIETASWAGRATDALTDHLYRIGTTVRKVIDGHQRIVRGLQEAAGHLDAAVSSIPVPAYIKPEATQRQAAFASSGRLDEYRPNEFYDRMPWSSLGFDHTSDAQTRANLDQRFWAEYQNYLATADKARDQLMTDYAKDAQTIGTGGKVASPQVAGGGQKPGTGGSKNPGSGALSTGVGNPGMPMSGMTPSMPSTPLGTTGMDPSTLPSDFASPGLTSPDLGSSSLASGLGSSGLGAAGTGKLGGTGLAGLAPLGAGGAGVGGFGGLGSTGLGPAVSPEEMVGETPGAFAAGGGAGGAAGLAGAGSNVMGMAPGGAGGAGGLPTDNAGQTETKLIEDDKSIFGPRLGDRDLPGDVIG